METKEKKPRRLRWILTGIVILLVAATVSAEALQPANWHSGSMIFRKNRLSDSASKRA